MAENARRAEASEAQKLIDAFLDDPSKPAPQPLTATTYAGASVKTTVTGWYLNRRRTIAIGTDGGYYRLLIPNRGLLDRFRPVRLDPEPPPLVVGANGKDGEGGELSWFLERVRSGETAG